MTKFVILTQRRKLGYLAHTPTLDERNKSREKGRIRRAETLEMRNNVLEICEKETHEKSKTDKNFVKSEINHQMLNCFDLVTAAKLIYQEIRDLKYDMNYYPSNEDVSDVDTGVKLLPKSLQLFLEKMIPNKRKQVSIDQSIVCAAHPRSMIPTLLFGLGIEREHMYGSRWLVNRIYRLGFCITYEEVVRFKQSVSQSHENTVVPCYETSFLQWSAGNVDHNTATFDGKRTFHGMGMIAISTPAETDVLPRETPVKRITKQLKANELIKNKGVLIDSYSGPSTADLPKFKFVPLQELYLPPLLSHDLLSDMLWQISWNFHVLQTQV